MFEIFKTHEVWILLTSVFVFSSVKVAPRLFSIIFWYLWYSSDVHCFPIQHFQPKMLDLKHLASLPSVTKDA